MLNERKLTKTELAKREDIIMNMKKNKRSLVKKYGKDAEAVMYGRATNQAKKQSESMKNPKLTELIKDALKNPKKADLNKDGKLSDYEEKRGAAIEKSLTKEAYADLSPEDKKRVGGEYDHEAIAQAYLDKVGVDSKIPSNDLLKIGKALVSSDYGGDVGAAYKDLVKEDLDLGHQDNEPGMLKAELYHIGSYAMELYKIMDDLEGMGEIDLPSWWQSKITTAKNMISSAKHYLDFELKEPQIDAMVNVAAEEDVIGENQTNESVSEKTHIPDETTFKMKNGQFVHIDDRFGDEYYVTIYGSKGYDYGKEKELSLKYIKNKIKSGEWKEVKESVNEDLDAGINVNQSGTLGDAAIDRESASGAFEENLDIEAKVDALQRLKRGEIDTLPSEEDAKAALVKRVLDKLAKQKMEEGLPKGFFDKAMDAKDEDQDGKVDESYATLVNKLEKQGKGKKAAKAIAGAVASYKAKGGGKGPTAKQK